MTHEQFETKKRELGALINAPEEYYPWVGRCNYDGDYVEIDQPVPIYRWAQMERGREVERRIFLNEQDLLYHVFQRVTGQMAFFYEFRNRAPNQDSRRLAFEYQLKLLEKIDQEFRVKREKEIEELLAIAPYRDES